MPDFQGRFATGFLAWNLYTIVREVLAGPDRRGATEIFSFIGARHLLAMCGMLLVLAACVDQAETNYNAGARIL